MRPNKIPYIISRRSFKPHIFRNEYFVFVMCQFQFRFRIRNRVVCLSNGHNCCLFILFIFSRINSTGHCAIETKTLNLMFGIERNIRTARFDKSVLRKLTVGSSLWAIFHIALQHIIVLCVIICCCCCWSTCVCWGIAFLIYFNIPMLILTTKFTKKISEKQQYTNAADVFMRRKWWEIELKNQNPGIIRHPAPVVLIVNGFEHV